MDNNAKLIEEYKGGRSNVLDFFVGQVMKKSRGKANPAITAYNAMVKNYNSTIKQVYDLLKQLDIQYIQTSHEPAATMEDCLALEEIVKFIYDNIMYAELNTKSDYCQECGFDGEIEIVRDAGGKLIWKCPKCGNTDESKLNVARRTCGYIGSQFWNQGRTQEIKERVLHVD